MTRATLNASFPETRPRGANVCAASAFRFRSAYRLSLKVEIALAKYVHFGRSDDVRQSTPISARSIVRRLTELVRLQLRSRRILRPQHPDATAARMAPKGIHAADRQPESLQGILGGVNRAWQDPTAGA